MQYNQFNLKVSGDLFTFWFHFFIGPFHLMCDHLNKNTWQTRHSHMTLEQRENEPVSRSTHASVVWIDMPEGQQRGGAAFSLETDLSQPSVGGLCSAMCKTWTDSILILHYGAANPWEHSSERAVVSLDGLMLGSRHLQSDAITS